MDELRGGVDREFPHRPVLPGRHRSGVPAETSHAPAERSHPRTVLNPGRPPGRAAVRLP